MTRGAVEAIIEAKSAPSEDNRQCHVSGRPILGMGESLMREGKYNQSASDRHIMKALMVHGVGTHIPGYSTRLADNLAQAMSLNRTQEYFKEFKISHPDYPGQDLGVLRISRFLDADGLRELQFFELTWEPIIAQEKSDLAFDNSGEYSYRRASINETLKSFLNDTMPDVVMYYGKSRKPIQVSVIQAICWMMSSSWDELPDGESAYCNTTSNHFLSQLQDDYIFITHSLGSRILTDAIQRVASITGADGRYVKSKELLRNKEISIFMLSNQLPILQLGRKRPEVANQIDEICPEDAPRSGERLFKRTRIVAFSDPNDLFSYAIPPRFLRNYVDSRLCPTLTNVSINITPVSDLFGLGEFANPLDAHTSYDNDFRVIDLMTNGLNGLDDDLSNSDCDFMEAVPDKF